MKKFLAFLIFAFFIFTAAYDAYYTPDVVVSGVEGIWHPVILVRLAEGVRVDDLAPLCHQDGPGENVEASELGHHFGHILGGSHRSGARPTRHEQTTQYSHEDPDIWLHSVIPLEATTLFPLRSIVEYHAGATDREPFG